MTEEYRGPGVNVIIERGESQQTNALTEFYPVFIGKGATPRTRTVTKAGLRADVSEYPKVKISFDLSGDVNTTMTKNTKFSLGTVIVTKATILEGGSETISLENGVGYEIVEDILVSSADSKGTVTIEVLDGDVVETDVIYDINISLSNVDADYDLIPIGSEDRFALRNRFGSIVLQEDGKEFFNDIAIAAEIAFRMEIPRFYILEVPREFGSEEPTVEDYKKVIEKVYFESNAYRLVALTSDNEVIQELNNFVSGVSNPIDKREMVSFVTYDTSDIANINDMDELVDKVGGLSVALNNKRVCNIFGGESVELTINRQTYVLPEYFLSAAVASLDTVVGKVNPLSLREITVFDKINVPRFRPRVWDRLAKKGVFIIKQDNESGPIVIRHQLTTSQSEYASDQEYSVVKNWDVVTKFLRDRFKPYAGQNNINTGYIERLDGTMTSAREEILEAELARGLEVITEWSQRSDGDGRSLVTRLKMDPVLPGNQLEIYLIV